MVKNGELLVLAAKEFDVFVTVDRNLSFPQHIPTFDIAAIGLRGKSNRLTDLQPLLPELLASIPTAGRGVATFMGSNPTLEATRDYLNQGEADAEN